VATLQILGGLETAAWLAPRGLLGPAMMVCGFWLGYLARLAVYARFELRHANSQMVFAQHTLSVAGFCALVVLWLPDVPALAAAWSALLAGMAWISADSFLFYVGTQKPEIKRPTDR
jgi:membrane protein YqaA with SNARE-associated domain